jgi:hypothetical protein
MKFVIKVAGTGIVLDTNMDEKYSNGTLYGIPYKIAAGGELDVYRSAFKADGMTGWDRAYSQILQRISTSTNVLRVGIPTTKEVQEFHYNPGVHAIIGPTGSGKNFTLFRGIKPFVDMNPTRSSSIYSYGEDKIEGGIKLNDPEELFVELASDILDQIASFFAIKDGNVEESAGSLKGGNGYADKLITLLNKDYDNVDAFMENMVELTPLPRIVYLDSIRDFVYSKGIQGAGGFNMRIVMEVSFLKSLVEELNMHLFVTMNPLVSYKDKDALDKIESDAESSTSTVLSLRPTKLRDTTPGCNLYARGASNAERAIREITIRDLILNPVDQEELNTFAAGVITVMSADDSKDDYSERETVSYAAESIDNAPVKAAKTYGTKAVRKVNVQQDLLLSALSAITKSVNSED